MYIVAVRGTPVWRECATESEAVKTIEELTKEYPQENIILAEQLELVIMDGEIVAQGECSEEDETEK